ncbi:hypothetical protein NKI88_25305 [Mesorhizobium sp. M0317]|uniref:ATP-dependent DNA ligase n=1 Tax=Mesorhizobium sp. M0317 TaxID=2956935 RepID=UPI00333BF062
MRLKFIRPMEPELFDVPPAGDDWSHEIKFDGYRTQVIKDEDGISFFTKKGFDWTARYRYLAEEAAAIDAENFILEGEAISDQRCRPVGLSRDAGGDWAASAFTGYLSGRVRSSVPERP